MLSSLTVRDIVLIESASLEFGRGLNVLTGETGAGKSILLDALGLATGGRGQGRAGVRPGAAQGSATAIFEPAGDHPARALLKKQDIGSEDELVLRRTLTSDGRTRAFANDEPVGIGLLKDLGASLIEVHGQADDRGLFDVTTHRALLDRFGGHEALRDEVDKRYAEYDQARKNSERLHKAGAEARLNAKYVTEAADELGKLDPQEGEEAALAGERALLMNAARIAQDVSACVEALAGETGAEQKIAASLKRLSRMSEDARKAAHAAETALEQAFAFTEEARRELDALLSRLEADPAELERKEDRLHALRAAARKYGVTPEQLGKVREDFEAQRDALDLSGGKLKEADAAVSAARESFLAVAAKLTAARATAAKALEVAVARELTPLKLAHVQFRVRLEPLDEGNAQGLERVAFEVATIEGAQFGSLAKIASGGELARLSLALKVALAESADPAALVFDEVDRGVGGAVADAVGERLQRLSAATQVLLVTHSPQVAARAERHFRITRLGDKTRVELLSAEARLEEIARMLSGAAVTEEARAAARRLLAEAARPPSKTRKRA